MSDVEVCAWCSGMVLSDSRVVVTDAYFGTRIAHRECEEHPVLAQAIRRLEKLRREHRADEMYPAAMEPSKSDTELADLVCRLIRGLPKRYRRDVVTTQPYWLERRLH